MKAKFMIPVVVGAVAVSLMILRVPGAETDASQAQEETVYWYFVDQDQGVDLAGYSHLAPDKVADAISAGKYLCLMNYRSRDANGNWSAAASERIKGTIYVKPALVRTFEEIHSDPLGWKRAGPAE